jgi:glycosyltransferase involved in cell wall biosynthesis
MELGLGKGPLMIAIGRLTHQKDPISFVEIAAAVRRRVPSVRAVWVGDGELRGAVEERIAALNLQDAISITGWLEDVRPYIAAADLFVSTSRYESFGYVTAEALAMERPVVASKITGTVDVVKHDVEHQLFTPFDVDAATKRAAFLLSDPLLAAAIARRGRAFVNAEFSVEATRRGLAVAYNAARRGGS